MRDAETKDTTKISAPVPKLDAAIQFRTKERIPKLHAVRNLLKLNPNPEIILSNPVKNTSNKTRTKSPTRSEQENQSDSSEDTTVLKFFENFGNEEDNSPTVPTYGCGYYTKENVRKKRSPPSPPLTVGGLRVKRERI